MGNDCESAGSISGLVGNKRPVEINLKQVVNGFVISGYGSIQTKIANTLPEALELIRKEFGS